ncbi:MAG: hypothetical protein AAB884_02400, partial [Patescibacteria group bacterium]
MTRDQTPEETRSQIQEEVISRMRLLVGKRVIAVDYKPEKDCLVFNFDDCSNLEVSLRSGPGADHSGWYNVTEVRLNGRLIL